MLPETVLSAKSLLAAYAALWAKQTLSDFFKDTV